MEKILLVEDDLENCEILGEYLTLSGHYEATIVHDAETALLRLQQQSFDLILLDIILPGQSGIDLCAQLRQKIYCPIIFISCLADDETIIRAMKLGGDDYLTKPFRYPVLEARIEAVLRRTRQDSKSNCGEELISLNENLTLFPDRHILRRDSEEFFLSPTEFALLMYFIQNPDRILTFEEIYQHVWKSPSLGDLRTVFSHTHNLRKKIEKDPANPQLIRTIPRTGYRFTPSGAAQNGPDR